MIPFIIRIAINAAALLLMAQLSDGAIVVRSFWSAFVVALVLGLAGATVKPLLESIAKNMTCVLSCLTLGLWSLVVTFLVNGLLFWLAAQWLDGIQIKNNSFWVAAVCAFILACVNAFASAITKDDKN